MERHSISNEGVEAQNNDNPISLKRLSDTLTSVSSTCRTGYFEIHDGVINFLKKVGRRTDTEGGRRTVSFTKKEIIEKGSPSPRRAQHLQKKSL